mmetsp:Transcript_75815/g.214355  ORF Transcript_75815/g.214355 Transcript_75815/m.214355 type:complete len:474 (+) Transcript_75815:122-1543(+)
MADAEDLLGDGRLLKHVVVQGDGPCPTNGKRVEVHYESFVASSGAKIDSSRDRAEPFDFVLGGGDVLEAWDLGVATMRPGEASEFTVDASLAYGEDGAGDDIPPGAVLKFTIELLTGKKPAAPEPKDEGKAPAGEEQRIERATEAKERGNALTKESEFERARDAYQEALNLLRACKATELELLRSKNKLRLACLLNLAQCSIKLEDFAAAVRHATEALAIEPRSCKALYRRGVARMSSGDLPESHADLLEASRLDPRSAEVRGSLQECKDRIAQCHEWDKTAFGGMFGKTPVPQIIARDRAKLTKAWLTFQIGDASPQRMRLLLYSDTVPRTAENFRALCTGERGLGKCKQPLHYKRTLLHKVVPRSILEAGDIENYDGTGGESIYGPTFEDEGFGDIHHRRGLLSMSNRGPDTNNSKFFITLRSLPQFDGKHVVFGEVAQGMDIVEAIEKIETTFPDKPVTQVAIIDSGEGW